MTPYRTPAKQIPEVESKKVMTKNQKKAAASMLALVSGSWVLTMICTACVLVHPVCDFVTHSGLAAFFLCCVGVSCLVVDNLE